jgi:hypothetical protein
LDLLQQIEAKCLVGVQTAELSACLKKLSPVGVAAMYEAGIRRGVDTGRYVIYRPDAPLRELAASASAAGSELRNMYSPTAESAGQGSGSSFGRVSDLEVLTADYGRRIFLRPFRSPKDKLGFALISAVARYGHPLTRVRQLNRIAASRFLDAVWISSGFGDLPSWATILTARQRIADAELKLIGHEKQIDLVLAVQREAMARTEI